MTNKKTPIALISGIVLIAILIIAFLSYKEANLPEEPREEPAITEEKNDKVEIVSIEENTDALAIDVEYPTVGSPMIDNDLRMFIEDQIAEFKNNTGGFAIPGRQNILTIKVLDVYRDDETVSVKFSVYTDTGGAHGLGIIVGKNYNRTTGTELFVDDALSMMRETLWSLSEKTLTHFRDEMGEVLFEDGLSPQTENFKNFTISEQYITFYFAPYQIAAYALGPQEFTVERIDE
ncbi:MAG: hypothetical protein COV34_00535 [Candidatus Zambryskibacteria bacterium CG10_big_fil_rev_8_21_14_0_10_42_12]|uniref:Uncharacterized protein n=1 Tax=Candidatus Zambryskibacteria bacterium CG10_big_fil_rev_8_21_14_0_10_42_12 TaxID=1975115 RepID=A0A2H0QWY9_9BACT|nr:MAG: hypothetical protein COV34_00535 [Candidatus Zambryskibacteria bacterium CG10_big_fil_rev_8_21_14_0_10_42_12]